MKKARRSEPFEWWNGLCYCWRMLRRLRFSVVSRLVLLALCCVLGAQVGFAVVGLTEAVLTDLVGHVAVGVGLMVFGAALISVSIAVLRRA